MSQNTHSDYGDDPRAPHERTPPGMQSPQWGTYQRTTSIYAPELSIRRKRSLPLLIVVGILILVVLSALVVSVVIGVTALNSIVVKSKQIDQVAAQLGDAATNLSHTPGARYIGTVTSTTGDKIQVDIKTTNNGSLYGTLIQDNEKFGVLTVDNGTYLKASKSFWSEHGVPDHVIDEYTKRWVKVPDNELGISIQKLLAPSLLGQQLRREASSHQFISGPETTFKGVKVRRVDTPQGTLFVTIEAPQRIIHIETTPASIFTTPPVTEEIVPVLFQATASDADNSSYGLDVSNLPPPQIDDLYKQLQDTVQDLKNSIDSQVQFALNGSITLAPCTSFGCTANLIISNSVLSNSPYLQASQPVTASITVNFTLDGSPIGGCPDMVKTMPPNGSTAVECSVSYSIPPAENPTMHTVEATAFAFAQAIISADIPRIIDDLKKEQKAIPQCPVPNNELTSSATEDPLFQDSSLNMLMKKLSQKEKDDSYLSVNEGTDGCIPSLKDILATKHGQENLRKRGFSDIEVALIRSTQTAYEQENGAIAYVAPFGPNRYGVVVVGQQGIITAIRVDGRRALDNLARNYDWTGYP